MDILSHSLMGPLLFFGPFFVFGVRLSQKHWLLVPVFLILSAISELKNHLDDLEYDKKAGLNTTACALGEKRAEKILKGLFLLVPVSFLPSFIDWMPLLYTASALVFYAFMPDSREGLKRSLYNYSIFMLLLLILKFRAVGT